MKLEDLPNEILLEILSYQSLDDIHKNVALVSKRFLKLSRMPNPLVSLHCYCNSSGASTLVMLKVFRKNKRRSNFNAKTLEIHKSSNKLDIRFGSFCEGSKDSAAHNGMSCKL